jgi:hypothetical protein
MTWGTHCPQCGQEYCEWVQGAICHGLLVQAVTEREGERAGEKLRAILARKRPGTMAEAQALADA